MFIYSTANQDGMWGSDYFLAFSSLLEKPHSEGSWEMESGTRVVCVKYNGFCPQAAAHKRLPKEPANGSSIKQTISGFCKQARVLRSEPTNVILP